MNGHQSPQRGAVVAQIPPLNLPGLFRAYIQDEGHKFANSTLDLPEKLAICGV